MNDTSIKPDIATSNLPANKKAKAIQKKRAAENTVEAKQQKRSAAIYLRVSSEMQVDGFSIEAQKNACLKYAKEQGYEVTEDHKYIDEAYSAKNEERPAFQRMILAAHSAEFSMIIIHKMDRFERNFKAMRNTLEDLANIGVHVFSISENMEIANTVESISATDVDGIRKLSMNEDVWFITGTTYVSGDVKDGSRIAGFADIHTRNVIALTVAEVADQGGYMEGKIEEITSEQIQAPEKKDWYHLVLGGMYNLVGDKTVLISEGLKLGDKVSGYYFGPERKLLAVLEEDTSLLGRIRNASLPVKIGMGAFSAGVLGSGAALGIGSRKKRFSGILELESDSSILIHDPSEPRNVKRYKLPKKMYETACLLTHKRVSGFTRFGKVEKIDLDS